MEISERLVGTHREIGRQRGEIFKPIIWEHVERLKYLAAGTNSSVRLRRTNHTVYHRNRIFTGCTKMDPSASGRSEGN